MATTAAAIGVVWTLNATVYSAEGFVTRYLAAIADDDVAAIMRIPGVQRTDTASVALLRSGIAHASPRQVRAVARVDHGDGTVTLTMRYLLGGQEKIASFTVRGEAPLFGLFDRWRFAESPLGTLDVSVAHGVLFQVGPLILDARRDPQAGSYAARAQYQVLAPSAYGLGLYGDYLAAEPVIATTEPGAITRPLIDLQPTDALIDRVQGELNTFLTACAQQDVLQPAGCPFGVAIPDRLLDSPRWQIVNVPKVRLTAGTDAFVSGTLHGVARIVVSTQRLYDGSRASVDRLVPFGFSLAVSVAPAGDVTVRIR